MSKQNEVENEEGFIRRDERVYQLSLKINQMIVDFEKDNDFKIICSGQAAKHYREAYPHEPKVILLDIL